MNRTLGSLAAGLLFGAGLLVSGMTKPSKVIGFLDVTGEFDASLGFVMLGGIAVHFILFRLITKRASPLLEFKFQIPTRKDLDRKLVVGAALFGIGWGLGGFCPGPALTSLSQGAGPFAFVLAMVAGMYIHDLAANALPATPSNIPQIPEKSAK